MPGSGRTSCAGCGSNSTLEAIHLSREAHRSGADAVMIVVPYYNRPTQDGLVAHYVAVAREVPCPVVVYNVPARTGERPPPRRARTDPRRGAERRRREGGDGKRAPRAGARAKVRDAPRGALRRRRAHAADGRVGRARGHQRDVEPPSGARSSRATELALTGDRDAARRAHLALLPVHEAMFVESNPAPVKAALAAKGAMRDVVRGPLVAALAESARARSPRR